MHPKIYKTRYFTNYLLDCNIIIIDKSLYNLTSESVLPLKSAATTTYIIRRANGARQWGVLPIIGEMNSFTRWGFVLQVDHSAPVHSIGGIHLSLSRLFGLLEQNVDLGVTTWGSLVSSFDQLFNLVVGHFDIDNLGSRAIGGEPKDMFGFQCDQFGGNSVTHEFESAGRDFLSLALSGEWSARLSRSGR